MSFIGKSPNVNRLRLNPRSADPTNPTDGDVQYADGSAREEGVWVYKNGAWGQIASSSSGGINYVTDGDGESGQTTNWATYADAAAAVPVNGEGGSPNVTFAITSTASEVLRGSRSLKFVKDAANRQGQGVANTIALERQDYEASKNLFLSFDYKTTANFATGDIRCFVYDITNAIVYNVQSLTGPGDIAASTTANRFVGSFQSVASSTDYRVIFHVATTNALAYDLILDEVSVSPDMEVPGAIVQDLGTETWVDSFTNATTAVRLQRVGNRIFADGKTTLTGVGTTGLTYTVPAAYTATDSAEVLRVGTGTAQDTGVTSNTVGLYMTAVNTITVYVEGSAGTYVSQANPTATVPFTWANGDFIHWQASWVVSGWLASAALNTTETMLSTVTVGASGDAASASSGNPIIFPTKTYDAFNAYNNTTGRFTAPKTGKYRVSGALTSASAATTLSVFVDGVSRALAGSLDSNGEATFNATVSVSAGQLIDLRPGGTVDATTSSYFIEEVPDFSIFSVYGQTEYSESKASGAVTWPFAASTYGDLTSLTLQPGEYDLTGIVEYENNGAVTAGFNVLGISTTSGNSAVGLAQGDSRSMSWNVGTTGLLQTHTVPNYRVVVTTPTTYYLKGYYGNTITNLRRQGYKLSARRIK